MIPQAAQAQGLYREIEEPKGKPVGAMLAIHGGGWRQDPAAVVSARDQARRFSDEGWLVWNVDYGSGAAGFDDIEYWHRELAEKTKGPLCVYGGSAGASFALLLAGRERIECVIADAPATDLVSLPDPVIKRFVVPAFGNELDEFSPLTLATERPGAYADTRILLGHLEKDVVVPIDQSTRFADALPFEVPVFGLPAGPAPFEHGAAAPGALGEYQDAQSNLLSEVVASHQFGDVPFATERVAEILATATQQSG